MRKNSEIPQCYGDNKIVLMTRDPWTLYSYWEIKKEVEDEVKESISQKGLNASKSVLRIYEVTGEAPELNAQIFCEYELRNWANSWYVHTESEGKQWMAEIGILADNGDFFSLAKSNVVNTPTHKLSDKFDANWLYPMGDLELGDSSIELDRNLKKGLSSGGISSGAFTASGTETDIKN
jgi:hypothetical protein